MSLSGSPDKRRRRTREQVEALEDEILSVLANDRPQSIRHVFYRLTDPRLPEPVEKSERGYSQVQARITKMRRAGKIPYGWITDATRMGWHTVTYNGAADFLQSVAGLYRQNMWANSDFYVELWVESRSIAGVLTSVCKELGVSLYPCGGFSSITLAYDAAQIINEQFEEYGKTPIVLFVGDYDPAGLLIDEALKSELREHLLPDARKKLQFERLGISPWHIHTYDLPTKPRKASDRRRPDIKETVEAEALPAGVLRDFVWGTINNLLPEGALKVAKKVEAEERKAINLIADRIAAGDAA